MKKNGTSSTRAIAIGFIVLIADTINLTAGTTNTNQTTIAYQKVVDEMRIEKGVYRFWDQFEMEFLDNSKKTYYNKFGIVSGLKWTRRMDANRYGIHDHIAETGKNLVIGSALDALRDAAVGSPNLDVDHWQEFGEDLLVGLFKGSIGNTAEEHIDPLSTSPTYETIERSWWQRTREANILRYGIRPWDGYSYIDADIGRWGQKPLLSSHFKIATPIDGRIGTIRLQEKITIPLSHNSQMSMGASVDPKNFGSTDDSALFTARVEHIFRNGKIPGVFYFGLRALPYSNVEHTVCELGFFRRW